MTTFSNSKIKGCVHLILKKGKIANLAVHLVNLPKDGVVHLKPDGVYSFIDFKKTHPEDIDELSKNMEIIKK